MVTDTVPLFVVSTVEVAVTVRVAALSLAATERTPPALIVVPTPPPLTNQVTVWAGLLVPVTVALKVAVPPFATLAVAGLTVTPETIVTAIVAVPLFVASTVEVAVTVSIRALSSVSTFRTPPALMLVPTLPPLTVHVTV
jgi:hypothetical protein